MKYLKKRRMLIRVAAHCIFSAGALAYMYPFLWMLASSLKTRGEFFASGLRLVPQQPRWQNYLEAWQKARFGAYFLNTIVISIAATTAVVIITSAAGYALARSEFPSRRLLIGLMVVTMFLPHGYTIIPIFEIVKRLGLLNTLWAVILVNTGTSLVFNTLLFSSYFITLPRDLEDSAILDGAGFPRVFWSIALPFALPMVGAVTLFEFVSNWNGFFIPLVFTLGRPDLRTVAVGMYAFFGENTTDWTLLCAAATLSLLPTIVLFLLLQRTFVNGVVGALKA